jgi:formylglycine-generating enzyme required for sulfatase activity
MFILLLLLAAAFDSPPAVGLRVGDNYGVLEQGKLVPEIVKHGKIEISRFETTRAQYFAFDTGYPIEKGTENFPANGITPRQAQAYAGWLSGIINKPCRLPNEDEAATLYKDAGEKTGKLHEVGATREEGPIYDLGGNVSEWVEGKDGKFKLMGGSAAQPSNREDPDPMFSGFRVVCGKPK